MTTDVDPISCDAPAEITRETPFRGSAELCIAEDEFAVAPPIRGPSPLRLIDSVARSGNSVDMLAQELLSILVCPETKQPVQLGDAQVVMAVNERIRRNELRNRAGAAVTDEVEGLLVREDRRFGYPVREDIPIMLIDEAIPLENA